MSILRWEIYLANLDPVVGSEQGKTRPVLVVSHSGNNALLRVVNVLPLTSRKPYRHVYPNEALIPREASGLPAESIALAYQIRTLDKQRLIRRLGKLNDPDVQDEVVVALRFQLGLLTTP